MRLQEDDGRAMNGPLSVPLPAGSATLPTALPEHDEPADAEHSPVEVTFADVALFMPLGRAYSFSIPDALRASP